MLILNNAFKEKFEGEVLPMRTISGHDLFTGGQLNPRGVRRPGCSLRRLAAPFNAPWHTMSIRNGKAIGPLRMIRDVHGALSGLRVKQARLSERGRPRSHLIAVVATEFAIWR